MVQNSYQSHICTFRIQTFHISCLLCIEFCQVLLILIERFIMLPRSRSRTHQIYVLLLHWKYAKICFSSTSKCFTPTLEVNKNMLDRFSIHQINAPSSCKVSLKVLLQKRDMGLCKRKSEKRKKKERVEKMDTKVSEILKTMGT